MAKKRVSVPWNNNLIQFARFIAEGDFAGAFTKKIIYKMADSMDLDSVDVLEILGRAHQKFDKIKQGI